MEPGTDFVALLRRWEDAGGVWRVLGQDRDAVTVGLYRCDDGEEADRFVATDPQLAQFLVGRTSSQDPPHHEPADRDRDSAGRARQARPRDRLGRPLPYGSVGVEPVSEEPLPPMATISYAHELLIKGRPFSAHEVYEARWKAGPDSERELWQGLAQLCVGITHAERGNRIGALRLVGRARRRLETYAATGGAGIRLRPRPHHRMDPKPGTRTGRQLLAQRSAVISSRLMHCDQGGVRCGLVATRDMGSSQLPALRRWFGCAITVIMLIELGACAAADQSAERDCRYS